MSWQWGWIRGLIPFLLNLLLVLNIICWPIALLIPTTDAVLRVFVEFVFGHKRQKESEEECVRTWLGRKAYDSDGNEFYVVEEIRDKRTAKDPTLANQSSCISSSGRAIQTKRWLGSPSATSTVPIRWYSSSAMTWKRCYAMNTNEYFYVLRSRVTCSTHI